MKAELHSERCMEGFVLEIACACTNSVGTRVWLRRKNFTQLETTRQSLFPPTLGMAASSFSSSPLHVETDDAAELARQVEAVVVSQTSPTPSGLDRDTERKAAAHICRAFPPCFGLKDAKPDSLNEVAFLLVRHLTHKSEQRRNTKKAARVDFLVKNRRPKHVDIPPYCHSPGPTAISPVYMSDLCGVSRNMSMVRVERDE